MFNQNNVVLCAIYVSVYTDKLNLAGLGRGDDDDKPGRRRAATKHLAGLGRRDDDDKPGRRRAATKIRNK